MKVSRITALLCFILCLFMPVAFAQDDVAVIPEVEQDMTVDEEPSDPEPEPEPDLPAQYDLRDIDGQSYLPPIRNQINFGTCWAHAAIGASEANAIKKGANPNINLSEKALVWYAFHLQGSKTMTPEQYEGVDVLDIDLSWQYDFSSRIYTGGGTPFTGLGQMQTWNGASTEAQVPYLNSDKNYIVSATGPVPDPAGDWSLPYDDIYDDAYHLQNVDMLYGPATETITEEEFTPQAKQMILKYGAIDLTYCAQTAENEYFNATNWAQYTDKIQQMDHGVVIVGWDDDYPASNFNITPPGDGAWIVRNSWGSDWGDGGYFYLSYYDQTIGVVEGFDIETEELGYSYDLNNQYDFLNARNINSNSDNLKIAQQNDFGSIQPGNLKMANVFTAQSDQVLRAVSAFPQLNNASTVTAEVYILPPGATDPTAGTLAATVTKDFEHGGFYTIELPTPVNLPAGTRYSVVENMTYYDISYTEEGDKTTPVMPSMQDIAVEYGSSTALVTYLVDNKGEPVGVASNDYVAKVDPGQSYIYGLNGTVGQSQPEWRDITDPEITSKLQETIRTTRPME